MRIDHVGIAVRDLDEAVALYTESFGLAVTHQEEIGSQAVRVAFLADAALPSPRATQIELLEPTGDGAIARFLEKRGPGMHHVAFHAEQLGEALARLRGAGKPALDEPRPGARGHSVCFLHPRHAQGVLVELVG